MKNHFVHSILLLILACGLVRADFYISPQGSDANPGSKEQPFKTLERARAAVREVLKQPARPDATPPRSDPEPGPRPVAPLTVWLAEGRYILEQTFTLSREDSGTPSIPVVYRAEVGREVRLSGGRRVEWQGVKIADDPAILGRLDPAARGKVYQADLKAAGISNFGEVPPNGRRAEVYFNDQPLTLARWPNEGFAKIVDVIGGEPITVHGIQGDTIGKFIYEGDRPERWKDENDLWLHGYWFWDWSDQYQKVDAIDTEKHAITLAKPYHNYGYRKGQRFYAVNVLAELDSPGEWYLDRQSSILYFWPPEPIGNACIDFPVLEGPLVAMKDASNVVLRDLVLEHGRGSGVEISGGEGNMVAGCTLRNLGGTAVVVHGGQRNGVRGCDIYQVGASGISIAGGDRRTLTPAHNFAENNHLHHFARTKRTYAAAIHLNGVGNRAANNLIHDAPHMAVGFGGNENVMELNEIHDVCQETGDVGVFYTGRDWTVRGNVIRHNFIHHVHGPGLHGAQGVYLDDCASATLVEGNVLCDVARAMLIGGGRDNTIEGNLMVDCKQSVHFDNRGLNWMKYHVEPGAHMPKLLADMPYRQPPWSERYPQLLKLLEDDPGSPKGNVIRNNAMCRSPAMNLAKEVTQFGTVTDNPTLDAPREMDPQSADPRPAIRALLRADSPAGRLRLKDAFEKIGLRKDEYRKDWPRQWEATIQAFEAAEKKNPPPRGAVLFIGSSGIVLWKTLAQDFPEHEVINRGFGGSQIADSVYYAGRIVIPYKPRLIVLRAGTNDIAAGKTPEQVAADFRAFVEQVRPALPETRIVFMSLNPSPLRWANADREQKANRLIQEYIAAQKGIAYVDCFTPMLGPDGKPRPELYAADRLHNSPAGYKLWVELVRAHLR